MLKTCLQTPSFMLIDSHIHLDDPRFDADRQLLLSNARQAGIAGWVVPAISAHYWSRLSAVCTQHPHCFASYGIHPLFLSDYQSIHLQQLDALLTNNNTMANAIAVGECGLDLYANKDRGSSEYALQKTVFAGQLQLAKACNLPIIIHARGAVEDVILMIQDSGHHNGVVHSYNGSYEQAKRLMDLGYSLGFGGAVTYSRATRLRKLVTQLPDDALLIETDAPDQPDAEHTDSRHEPARLSVIAASLAALRQIDLATFQAVTTRNAINRFNLGLSATGVTATQAPGLQ